MNDLEKFALKSFVVVLSVFFICLTILLKAIVSYHSVVTLGKMDICTSGETTYKCLE